MRLIILLSVMLVGCTQATPVSKDERDDILTHLAYMKDKKHNLCYAVISSVTYGAQAVASITNVPCESVKDEV